MTLPTSQIPITAGAGTITAAEIIGGKYYGVPIMAGDKGHILGSRPSMNLIIPSVAGTAPAASKVHWDLFNASGTGVTLEVHGIYVGFNSDVAIAQALGIRFDLHRTSDIGTGSAIPNEQTTITNTFAAIDPADIGSKPAGVTARAAPSPAPTLTAWIGQTYLSTEEINSSLGAYVGPFQNMIRYEQMDDMRQLTIPENQGIALRQGPVSITAGQLNFRIVLSWY